MRQSLPLVLLLIASLAGCDGPAPATDSAPPPAAEQPPQAAEPAPEQPSADAAGTKPEIVEESAAVAPEPATGEQPIVLARNQAEEPAGDWKFEEGRHFQRLVPTQPTVGGADKIEVAEFFWYGCGHCLNFEPFLNAWAGDKPPNVRFVHVPAMWNPLVKLHAQLYYTEEALEENGTIKDPAAFRAAVFDEYHRRGNRLTSVSAIRSLFERHGVSGEVFDDTWDSFEVDRKLTVAADLAQRYSISGVPTIVVNGKYRAGVGDAGGPAELIELIDELIDRESAR